MGRGFWGDHFNRIIQLSTILDILEEENQRKQPDDPKNKVALGRAWTDWYNEWFAINDKNNHKQTLLLEYYVELERCDRIIGAKELQATFQSRKQAAIQSRPKDGTTNHTTTLWLPSPSLAKLIPKKSVRTEAVAAIQAFDLSQGRFVSVHRRSMDPIDCTETAARADFFFCFQGSPQQLGVPYLASFCNLTYTDMRTVSSMHGGVVSTNDDVVLFTDGQRPDLDKTFPSIDNHSFPVQAWMMVKSNVHIGNPLSSVDYVVAHWRWKRNMLPQHCYAP
jgi:hypothetical protein